MAYITFIARDEYVASYQLADTVTLGRSFDADIFIPDVFVSRHHCRFERNEEGWIVLDLESTNGIYFKGQRVKRRTLHEGDVVELGSIAFIFDEGDMEIPESSVAAPFGPGAKIAELIDTVCAFDARPADFVRQKVRKQKWKLLVPEAPPEEEPELVPVPEEQGEWTELDLEVQLVDADVGEPMMVLVPRGEGYAVAPMAASAAIGVANGAPETAAAGAATGSLPSLTTTLERGGSFRELAAAASTAGAGDRVGPKQVAFWDSDSPAPAKAAKGEKKEKKKKAKREAVSVGPSFRERIDSMVEDLVLRTKSNPLIAASVLGVVLLFGIGGYWYANRNPYSRLQAKYLQMSPEERKAMESASSD